MKARPLPIVVFDQSDALSLGRYAEKAAAITGIPPALSPSDAARLRYSLRVFHAYKAARRHSTDLIVR